MGRRRQTGLYKRGPYWWIDIQIRNHRLRMSTKCERLDDAIEILDYQKQQLRDEIFLGRSRTHTLGEALDRFIEENQDLRTIKKVKAYAAFIKPFIGDLALSHVNDDSIAPVVQDLKARGRKGASINKYIKLILRVCNLAAKSWSDGGTRKWLDVAPRLTKQSEKDARKEHGMDPKELRMLLAELPLHIRRMAIFKVNTGTRMSEVTGLRWEWEEYCPKTEASVFRIPAEFVKNKEERIVVLNRNARRVIDGVRGHHPQFCFISPRTGKPMIDMNTTAWSRARELAAARFEAKYGAPPPKPFRTVRVHDLKHTWGCALTATEATKSAEIYLLGHTDPHITAQYAKIGPGTALRAAEKVVEYYALPDALFTEERGSPRL